MKTKTCLNRVLGKSSECRKCEIDYGPDHPHNGDCLGYTEITLHSYEVKETEIVEETKNARI